MRYISSRLLAFVLAILALPGASASLAAGRGETAQVCGEVKHSESPWDAMKSVNQQIDQRLRTMRAVTYVATLSSPVTGQIDHGGSGEWAYAFRSCVSVEVLRRARRGVQALGLQRVCGYGVSTLAVGDADRRARDDLKESRRATGNKAIVSGELPTIVHFINHGMGDDETDVVAHCVTLRR